MSNDMYENDQVQSVLPQSQGQGLQHEDMPHERLSCEQKKALLAENPALTFSFSLEDLRSKWPDPKDRVEVIRLWLRSEMIDCFWPDRVAAGLLMLDELICLGGFEIPPER